MATPGGTYSGSLDWPATLAALMRLLGRRVTVHVGVPDARGPALVANVTGTLAAGWDLGVDEDLVGETLFFHFEEDSGAGFFVDGERFDGAAASDGGDHLAIRLGVVEVTVSEAMPA